ncbi:MAG TPA: hypothetical protein VMV98_09195 [Acidobacteriaceae bacterium]|nr:hypothetical protein [Acidobacteriaceae bacterium]
MASGPEPKPGVTLASRVAAQLNQIQLKCVSPKLPRQTQTPSAATSREAESVLEPYLVFQPLYPIAHFVGLPGNLAKTYKNNVALWESPQPNPAINPKGFGYPYDDSPSGDVVVPCGLSSTDYCMTYQSGAALSTMAAMVTVPVGSGTAPVYTGVTMEIVAITTTTVTIVYNTLPNYNPQTSKNWIGIWSGTGIPYTGLPALAKAEIQNPYQKYFVEISLQFEPYLAPYLAVYFTGPESTNIAAALSFTPPAS